jgi:GNAT superfamily N-acetyltransferase
VVRITPFTQPDTLDAALDALGLHRFDSTHVLVADLDALPGAPTLPAGLELLCEGPQAYAATVGTLRGSSLEQQQAHAERLATSPVPYQGWVVRRGPDVLACGQTAREGEQVGLYDVFTAPAARNQGLSRALCGELLARARGAGARWAYLQVDAANAPALAVYRRLGFTHGYDYHYRARDPGAA